MTSPQDPTTPPPPPPPDDGAPPKLTRSASDRMIGGVAGGLGRYYGVDPLLIRVAFAVLALAGGAGVLAYVALWLFVPEGEPASGTPAARPGVPVAAAVLVVVAWLTLTQGGFSLFGGPLLVIGGLLAAALAAAYATRAEGGGVLGRALAFVGALAVAVAVAVAGGLIAVAGGGVAIAVLVVVAGVVLVAGAFAGGARWLIAPALALASAAAFVAAADLDVSGGVGERSYRPASVTDIRDRYALGVGELSLDLRDVEFPAGERSIELALGVGEARVLVPDDVCVSLHADVGVGAAALHGEGGGGIDMEFSEAPPSPAGTPRLAIDADVGVGEVWVGSYVGPFGEFDDDGFPVRPQPPGRRGGGESCA